MHDEVNIDSHIHIYLELLRVGVPYHSGKKIAENLILIKITLHSYMENYVQNKSAVMIF